MADEDLVKIIGRLGIDFSQAVSGTRLMAGELQRLQAALGQAQITAQAMGRSVSQSVLQQLGSMRTAGQSVLQQLAQPKVIYDQYGRVLSVVAQNYRLVAAGASTAAEAVADTGEAAEQAASQFNVFASQMERRVGWFVAGGLFYGGLRALSAAIGTMRDVELGMVRIRKVINDQTADFRALRDELLALGLQYGQTAQDVLAVATSWAQAGYKAKELIDLTRTSLLSMNVAELDAEESVRLLISTLKQYNLTVEDSVRIVDMANQVSNDYAVSARDILEALSVSGGVARNAGISIQQLIGYIAALGEATGRTGKEVGNALRSIIAFSQRPKSIEIFRKIGVESLDASGNLRSMSEVLSELSEKWTGITDEQRAALDELGEELGLVTEGIGELTDVEKAEVAQAGANLFRRNYFISLMEHMATAYRATEDAARSFGSAERENRMFMEANAKQLDQLKAVLQELGVAFGESGVLLALKDLTALATQGVTAFNTLSQSAKTFVFSMAEVLLALKAASVIGRMLGLSALGGTLAGVATGATTLGAAVGALGTSLAGALPTLGLVAGISMLMTAIQESRRAAHEAEEYAKRVGELGEQYFRAQDSLSGLTEGTNRYSRAQEEVRRLMAEIAKASPELVTRFDELGQAAAIDEQTLRTLVERKRELTKEAPSLKKQAETLAQAFNDQAAAARNEQSALRQAASAYAKASSDLLMYAAGSREAEAAAKRQADAERTIVGIIGEARWQEIKSAKDLMGAMDELIAKRGEELETAKRTTREKLLLAETETRAMLKATDLQIQHANDALALNDRLVAEMESRFRETPPSSAWEVYEYSTAKEAAQKARATIIDAAKRRVELQKELEGILEARASLEATTKTKVTPLASIGAEQASAAVVDDYIDRVMAASEAQERANAEIQRSIDLRKALIALYAREGASLDELAMAEREQGALRLDYAQLIEGQTAEIDALRAAQGQLEARLRSVNTASEDGRREYEKLTDEIERTKDRIGRLQVANVELRAAMLDTSGAASQQSKAFDRAKQSFERYAAASVLSAREQIAWLKELRSMSTLTYDEDWRLRQQLAEQYEALLDEEQERIEQAYRKRLELLEEETEARIAAKQALIDALDEEDEQSAREEAEREHNQKLAQLQEERYYHELRTGREHLEAIADIDRQIAEENRDWQLKQEEWTREDKRQRLEQQIEDIRQAAKEQEKQWQKAYERMQADFSSHHKRLLALAATYDEQFFQDAKNKAEKWLEGFKSGLPEDIVGGYLSSLLPGATTAIKSGISSASEDATLARSKLLLEAKKKWQAAYEAGDEAGMAAAAEEGMRIRESGPTYDPGNTLNAEQLERIVRAAEGMQYGGLVLGDTLARLGERGRPEVVLPLDRAVPVLSDALRLSLERIQLTMNRGSSGTLDVAIERAAARVVRAIENRSGLQIDRILHIENMQVEDEGDIDILARQIKRQFAPAGLGTMWGR